MVEVTVVMRAKPCAAWVGQSLEARRHLTPSSPHSSPAQSHAWKQLDRHKSKQGNTTNMNISSSMENEKRAAQVRVRWDSNPWHTACEADALPTEIPRQLSWLGRIKAIQGKQFKAVFTLGRGLGPGAGPHVYTYISRTHVLQDPGPLGTVFLTVPADLGPGPDQLNQCFKHTWLFAVSIQQVKIAPELVVFLFLWVLRCRRTELARRVVLRRREARKQRFRFLQQILLTQELLLVPRIGWRTLYWRRRPRSIWRKPCSTNWWENIVLNTFTFHKSGIFEKAHVARKWACK